MTLSTDAILEGWLDKKQWIGTWKKQWFTITMNRYLSSYKTHKISELPIEQMRLSTITDVAKINDKVFCITTDGTQHNFKASSESEKLKWIECIDRYRHKCILKFQ